MPPVPRDDKPKEEDFESVLARPDVREAEFRVLFEYAIHGIAYVAPDGRFIRVNAQFAGMLGYSPKELELRRRWQDVTHPDDLDASDVESLLSGGRDSYRLDKRYLHKRGYSVYCEVLVTKVEDRDGILVHLVKQAAEIRLPDHNIQVVRGTDGHPILQPVVPLAEFLRRNWKWVAGVGLPAVGGVITTLGMSIANYYEVKARYESQQIEMKRLQDRLDAVNDVRKPGGKS